MPEWLDSGFVQTIVLLIATGLAFLTFLAERDARRDAAVEKRLDTVAARVAELAGAVLHSAHLGGQGHVPAIARRNLRSALELAPDGELPKARQMVERSNDEILGDDEAIDAALREVAEAARRLTGQR